MQLLKFVFRSTATEREPERRATPRRVPPDPRLHVHSVDVHLLPRLAARAHRVRGSHRGRRRGGRAPKAEQLAGLAFVRQRPQPHPHRIQLRRQLSHLRVFVIHQLDRKEI